ncbi:hypothetical protein MMC07_000338 [Pseudocyphellaria aurata]|nr:hypothetical protein [Pseudocyphellaria aurata]
MGSETCRRVSSEKPAEGSGNEIALQHNEPSPPLTNSMVTVRLSDAVFEFPAAKVAYELVGEDSAGHEIPKRESKQELAEEARSIKGSEYHSFQSLDDDLNEALPKFGASRASRSIEDEKSSRLNSDATRSRSNSSRTSSSAASAQVDWDELDKSEEQAPRDECSDASTAFLLARLEQENNALATDPKAAVSRKRAQSRPPSIQQLKKLVNEPTNSSLRYSMVPNPPPMTELEFWAALVVNYPQTAQRLPTLTSKKIRSGVPPPLRGVVWISIAGARDSLLEEEYDRLCGESSPYENLIGKDIGRSFPSVEMFRDPSGEGQKMLGKVLKCFSLYDQKIGYCQGLGFVVGPLLMSMGDKEAFCVLVRLMEHYDLRSCFLPDLSGLHLRIYQFQQLLSQHLPTLAAHLDSLQIEPLYVSQWFLSFFGVTCPLPMLLRIYDVILTEGASETLMRVALSLMRRNETKILSCTELEDVMQLLLSRGLWDTYACNADDLVNDFVGLTGLVTREGLENLETRFKDTQYEDSNVKISSEPHVRAAASRFLGRFWAGSNSSKVASPTSSLLLVAAPSHPSSFLRRTPSKQSMASTLNSIESAESHMSTTSTDATAMSNSLSTGYTLVKPSHSPNDSGISPVGDTSKDKDLHRQIEDLLMALSDMQRVQTVLSNDLQKEREEREEDRSLILTFIEKARSSAALELSLNENELGKSLPEARSVSPSHISQESLAELEDQLNVAKTKRSSIVQTKQQLREDVELWKDQHNLEATRSAALSRQLTELEVDNTRLLDQFREARTRMQDAHQDKQRLEKQIRDLKSGRASSSDTYTSDEYSPITIEIPETRSGGLREFKLGRSGSGSPRSQTAPMFSKRCSSLGIQAVLATEDHKPPGDDALLLELVNAKTAEAVAKQELEEVKAKLDSLRRLLGHHGPVSPVTVSGHSPSPSEPWVVKPSIVNSSSARVGMAKTGQQEGLKIVTPPTGSSGGFFSGWGKRTVSTPPAPSASPPQA